MSTARNERKQKLEAKKLELTEPLYETLMKLLVYCFDRGFSVLQRETGGDMEKILARLDRMFPNGITKPIAPRPKKKAP